MNVLELTGRDFASYYDSTFAYDKETNKAAIARVLLDEDERGVAIHNVDITDHSRAVVRDSAARHLSFSEFVDLYNIGRVPLGWRNTDTACLFACSSPGRGYKKGYTSRCLEILSPAHEHLGMYRNEIHAALVKGNITPEEYTCVMEKTRELLASSSIIPQALPYMAFFDTDFCSDVEEAVDLVVSSKVLGRALSKDWAIHSTITEGDSLLLFFQGKAVGNICTKDRSVSFYEGTEELEQTWNRTFCN